MTGSITRNLLSPVTWRRFWEGLGQIEEALSTTEGEIQGRRIARLESEIAELRAQAGLPPRAASPLASVASSGQP